MSSAGGERAGIWLCSHLIRILPEGAGAAEAALLEEIWSDGAAIGSEAPIAQGARLRFEAGGVAILTEVERFIPRENDYLLRVRFLEGYRWSPETWRPNHLYRPAPRREEP